MIVTLDTYPISNTWINGQYNQGVLTITDILEPTMQFMAATADQQNGTVLTIAVALPSSSSTITTMWLASVNHSDCTYCGTLQNNSVYKTTWIGTGGNYLWSTPTLVPSIEHFESSCPPCPPPPPSALMISILVVVVLILMILLFILLFRGQG